MNRFKTYNLKHYKIVFILICIILVYYELLINNKEYFINKLNSKYEFDNLDIKNNIIYSSLNKIISYEDIKLSKVVNLTTSTIKEEKINKKPIVYIYNTHEGEKYTLRFANDYSITPSVQTASLILKDYLNDYGIESFVQTKSIASYLKKHNLDYPGSYEASREYMLQEMKNNDYKILIDIHRDSSKYKYTLYKKDNVKYARVLFVLTTKHKNYKENEKFANYLNDKLNNDYKGLSRGIMKRKDVIFNQDLSNNAILIELGGVDNDLEEINNTLHILAKILNDYIIEEKL